MQYKTILFARSALSETGLRLSDVWIGLILVILVSLVIFGWIRRIGQVASMLVPLMILIYLLAVSYIVITNISDLPHYVALIFTDAFTAQAGAGGALGVMISNGIRRGAFSNEAGIGIEVMAQWTDKTR